MCLMRFKHHTIKINDILGLIGFGILCEVIHLEFDMDSFGNLFSVTDEIGAQRQGVAFHDE